MSKYVVVVSDLHLDAVTMGVSRFEEVRGALWQAVRKATSLAASVARPDVLFVCAGDVGDPDGGSQVFRWMAELVLVARHLEQQDVESHWVAGNHDVIEDGSGLTTLEPLKAAGAYVHDRPWAGLILQGQLPAYTERSPKVNLITLPFTATSHPYDPGEHLAKSVLPDALNVVVGHLTVEGVQPGEETTDLARGREVLFPLDVYEEVNRGARVVAINGHYHRRQTFLTPGGPILIPGSLARLTAGTEAHEPGYLVLEVA